MTVKDLLKIKIEKKFGIDCIVFRFVSDNFTYDFYKNGNSWKKEQGDYNSYLLPKGKGLISKIFLECDL